MKTLPTYNESAAQLSGMNIMILDDEESITSIFSFALNKFGANVLVANTKKQALELIEDSSFGQLDVLVTDLNIPDGNGARLAKKVKTERLCRHVILMSGNLEFGQHESLVSEYIDKTLNKPFNIPVLLEALAHFKLDEMESEVSQTAPQQGSCSRAYSV